MFKIVQKIFLILLLKRNSSLQDIANFQAIDNSYLKGARMPTQDLSSFHNSCHSFHISSNHVQTMQVNPFHATFHDFIFCGLIL